MTMRKVFTASTVATTAIATVVVSVVALSWSGYLAIDNWQQGAFLVSAEEVVHVNAAPFRATVAVVDNGPRNSAAPAPRGVTLGILGVFTLAIGLFVTDRAIRTHARVIELRSEFVATITHELKAPLTSIRAASETLVAGRVTEPAAIQDYARVITEETKRLTRLVDNALTYARITDVAQAYHFEPVSLAEIVDDALHSFAIPLQSKAIQVSVDMPDGLPPIRGDRTALALAFDNVIGNAIRYSDYPGDITIAGRLEGERVIVDVEDHGIGIFADELGLVRQKFFRGRNSRAGGCGLGLAIVDRIASDHGGSLNLRSTANGGTTVTLIWRASLAPEARCRRVSALESEQARVRMAVDYFYRFSRGVYLRLRHQMARSRRQRAIVSSS